MSTIGFIGVGKMGEPFVRRLLGAGHAVHIFDLDQAALDRLAAMGAVRETSAVAVAKAAPVLMTSLPTPAIMASVLSDDVLTVDGLQVIVDLSTSGPTASRSTASRAQRRGIAWVDSPVSGGVSGAEAGTLAVMVSAEDASFAQVSPLLGLFGKLFRVGTEPGLAQVAKIGNNLLAASAMVVTAEVMAMGVKAGLDADILIDIINAGTGRNTASEVKFPKQILNGKFAHGFATGLSYKDVRLCVDEAETLGVPMVAGASVREMLAVTQARYGADSDFTCIAKVLEEWAGVEIRSAETAKKSAA